MALEAVIKKDFGGFKLDVAFSAGNETMALLGASGCGKSLTLQCLAGVMRPDSGRIVLDGEVLFDSERHINVSPQQRQTGFLFQNYALFPHMTVRQNIYSGARREPDRATARARTDEIIERFALSELVGQRPSQLSGGQQQRVALARILVSRPRILLLDEPFSALDSHLRFRLEQEVSQVIHSFGHTVLLVSHDRDEVFRLCDSIAIMGHGRVEAQGPKRDIFAAPATRNGAILTGCRNISAVRPCGNGRVYATDWQLELELPPGQSVAACLGIRMHNLRVGGEVNAFDCRVVQVIENPFSYTVLLRPLTAGEDSTPLSWELDKRQWQSIQAQQLTVSLPPSALLGFDEDRS